MMEGASRETAEHLLATAPFSAYYGFRLAHARAGECALDVPFRPEFEREGGTVSGPVFVAAADAAMWLAILMRVGTAHRWVTADMTTAFLRGARGEGFTCTARVLKVGRQLVYGVAECVRADGRLLSHHTLTYARATADCK